MRLIPAFEASPKGYADLYQTVLVDTPIGPYFSQFLEQQNERLSNAGQVQNCNNVWILVSRSSNFPHPSLSSLSFGPVHNSRKNRVGVRCLYLSRLRT